VFTLMVLHASVLLYVYVRFCYVLFVHDSSVPPEESRKDAS
jgi:hypothetical protein